ncbi:MAG: phosphotransferase [Deltaproteobacteria bacterium]|jgi:Ser/Thr protein kinase RdoA (MazF antagonist)|nr:phosphotransferase [Deltaproteobacteria bacterium]
MMLNTQTAGWRTYVLNKQNYILRDLQQHFSVDSIRHVAADSWNAIFHARGKEMEYCVKIMNEDSFPVKWSIDEIDYIGNALNEIRYAGFKYVLPAFKDECGSYFLKLADYTALVFPWGAAFLVNGTDAPRIPVQAFVEQGAAVLSELHHHGCRVVNELGRRKTVWPRMFEPSMWLDEQKGIWTNAIEKMKGMDATDKQLRILEQAWEKHKKIVKKYALFFAPCIGEMTLLHGDYRPENILFKEERIQKIFDYDFLRRGLPEEDVAYAALYCSGSGWFAGPRDWDIVMSFIQAYQNNARNKAYICLQAPLLEGALYWIIMREIALIRYPEDILVRFHLLNELNNNLERIWKGCL